MKYDIITLGSATQDVFMSSKDFKEIDSDKFVTKKGLCVPMGSKMFMDDIFFAMGGTGTNTAVTFAKQGLKTAHLGAVGKDVSGDAVKKELSKHGVSLDFLRETDEYPTAYSVILSLTGVGRSILKKEGACHFIKKEDIPFGDIEADWFYAGSLSSESAKLLKPLIEFASEKNIKVAINPAGDTQLVKYAEDLISVLDKVDILILNQEECARLTGFDFNEEEKIFEKLDEMVKGVAVMTKGPDGVIVSDGKNKYSAGIPESEVIDRTGAGDAFGSAFTVGYMKDQDVVNAIQLGTANATAVLTERGAANGLLEKGDWGKYPKVEVTKI
ncbi:MAG: carbohydrate kinase family protein [Candidatus Marinimicrobia bacterium]|nr:carbohydrate kinase family protein [Candidatus Neomarinimicrobiota bacterium]